ALLEGHPKLFGGERRVRFKGFGESALLLEVTCWVATRSYDEYTRVVEELNFGIAGIADVAGCQFALPGRGAYVPRESQADAERLRAISEEVKRRRASGKLGGVGDPGEPGAKPKP
ncbi:MAG TPA: hypothetical protein VLW17_08075, partial [Thermoanaerobaculaceae bacterium]|nr:hypothetical protein [Thermoanaerobaculaceae bacterium]